MWIEKIKIQNCRIINDLDIEFHEKSNVIIGDNGSGKSSLIESLTLLSSGRSFRTSRVKEVISYNQESVLISALLNQGISNNTEQERIRIGIEKQIGKTRIRINQQDVHSQSTLSLYLPVTVIHPDSIKLVVGSPADRRAFLDWIAFYSFPEFHSLWKQYKHVLKQRNLCLKDSSHRFALKQWTQELASLQPDIHKFRLKSLELIKPRLKAISKVLLESMDISIVLNNGFPSDIELDHDKLLSFYNQKEEQDLKRGRTVYGVHRCDLNILVNGIPALSTASRGQLKLLVISLLLAQSQSIEKSTNGKAIILIDDLAAELDSFNQKRLLHYLTQLDQQLILTTTPEHKFNLANQKVFHVKHGSIVAD